jgi:hypothetical protein
VADPLLAGEPGIEPTGAEPYHRPAMSTDLDVAWTDLHDAKPDGWYVGRPSYDERCEVWEQYPYDPQERAQDSVRTREWTAVAPTELEVIRELARCLRLIREVRVPE